MRPPPDHPVLVIADAAPGVGLGHLARCTAVATGLHARGVPTRLLAHGATAPPSSPLTWEPAADAAAVAAGAPELLLVDSYLLDAASLQARTGARRLAVMHDVGAVPEEADFVLTTDPSLVEAQPHVIGGTQYTCLGPSYWGLPAHPATPERVRRVLVTMGGGDPGGHARSIAEATRAALAPEIEVTVVRGPQASFDVPDGAVLLDQPPSLLGPLRSADLVVTACGSSLLEALAVGTPGVGVPVADNQRPKAEEIAHRGAVTLVEPDDVEGLARTVRHLCLDRGLRARQSEAGQRLVDGYGALRVAFMLAALLSD